MYQPGQPAEAESTSTSWPPGGRGELGASIQTPASKGTGKGGKVGRCERRAREHQEGPSSNVNEEETLRIWLIPREPECRVTGDKRPGTKTQVS